MFAVFFVLLLELFLDQIEISIGHFRFVSLFINCKYKYW